MTQFILAARDSESLRTCQKILKELLRDGADSQTYQKMIEDWFD